jgi:hypothetical protein
VSQTVRGRERAVPYLSEQLSFEITQTDCFPGLSFQQEHLLYLYFSAISLCVTPGHSCVYSLNRNGNDFPAAVNPQEKMSSPWWWKQYKSPKRWLTYTSLHGATTRKTAIFVLTAVRTSKR